MTGSFDSSGCPTIEIEVSGPVTNPKRFAVMVDTGFSGFLLLPLLEAFPVGLILTGTTTVVLADGSQQIKLTCIGQVGFAGRSEIGLVIIEPQNTQALVGMEFLKKFRQRLIVDPAGGHVEVISSSQPHSSV